VIKLKSISGIGVWPQVKGYAISPS